MSKLYIVGELKQGKVKKFFIEEKRRFYDKYKIRVQCLYLHQHCTLI